MNDVTVRARVDGKLKEHATRVLDEMGLSVSEAIRLLLVQVVERRKLPFEIRALSPETVQALKDADAGKTRPIKHRDL